MKASFDSADFWQRRYKDTTCQHFEWLDGCGGFAAQAKTQIELLAEEADAALRVLELGCGSSKLVDRLAADYPSIEFTAVDFSKELIAQRRKRNSASNVRFEVADLTTFSAKQPYDLVLDKNTVDCVFCSQPLLPTLLKALLNVANLLKINGRLLSYSHGRPALRLPFCCNKLIPLRRVNCEAVRTKSGECWVYVLKRVAK